MHLKKMIGNFLTIPKYVYVFIDYLLNQHKNNYSFSILERITTLDELVYDIFL